MEKNLNNLLLLYWRPSHMNRVAIIGYSTSRFRKIIDESIFELACAPCMDIIRSTNFPSSKIDGVLFSSCSGEQYCAAIVSEMLGLSPKVTSKIDNLCNSGTVAIASAYSYIAAGLCNSILVVGAEMRNSPGSKLIWDVSRGFFSAPIYWASMFAKRHMREHGTTEEDLASVAVKNRSSSVNNPNALFNTPITLDEVLNSKKVVEPIKLLDCGALSSGSAGVLLVSEDLARQHSDHPVWIAGIGQQTNCASFAHNIEEIFDKGASRLAASNAYKMAKLGPKDIEVAEIHDAFTIMEIMAYEDLGFASRGEGTSFIGNSEVAINPRGGIIGSGHSIGATGVAQVCEIVCQLRQEAGRRQIEQCKVGLVHNLAAAGTSAAVIILRS
jgi:acetyl-CoA C-acetyltransferase